MLWLIMLFPFVMIMIAIVVPGPRWFPGLRWLAALVVMAWFLTFAADLGSPRDHLFWVLLGGSAILTTLMWVLNYHR
jgi:hypothetical protein